VRYYKIVISGKNGGQGRTYSSLVGGVNDPGALNVVLDIPVTAYATPMGSAYVQVWGVSLADISQASDLNGATIQVYGGMSKGLPLANPSQAGLLVQGQVFQAFGNWVGTDMTLDLIIQPSVGGPADPKNIVLNWKSGTKMSEALASTLSAAFPGFTQTISVSDKLVRKNNEVGYYQSLAQFSQYVKQVSRDIVGGSTYLGVDIVVSQNAILVSDGTQQGSSPKIKAISYQDLIGQPTWIESPSIQLNAVMRADINVGDTITLPKTVVTNTAAALSSLSNQSLAFQGTFQVSRLRHVGNLRQPDAASWITTMNAFPNQQQAA